MFEGRSVRNTHPPKKRLDADYTVDYTSEIARGYRAALRCSSFESERANRDASDSCQGTFFTLSGLAPGMRLPRGGRGKRRRE